MSPASRQSSDGHDILLEVGTNELEVMVFKLGEVPFCINVAKIREVIVAPPIRRLPESHPAIEGVFLLRGKVVPLVGLRTYLDLPPYPKEVLADPTGTSILVTEFNRHVNAFRVDSVEGICRIFSTQVDSLPHLPGFERTPITAVVRIEDQPTPMLDFETIFNTLSGMGMTVVPEATPGHANRGTRRIVFAEDSAAIRRMVNTALTTAGFPSPRFFEDGKQAWDWLEALGADGEGAVRQAVDIVITDIEMPQMDGLQLCRRIREHPALAGLPVVLFSSLITDDNRRKGEAVGATAQASKPELHRVAAIIDDIVAPCARPPGA